mmetsp:Transcript_3884/g.5430  ORF Transcript_3884/g.5430 Transcript_3884/m.5430 type:complete len:793 (-) Transcript_3884:156-2534(-)|eukprot:CAMPEP_0197295052 /NCGR_PEP_ID=MMETSP0890-20130614/34289_1 /TAXON_ID=44058 ORGANISM="Aureoumbra lagunensis, Strain CCMP1510" /NCGR_SAMPLE_ID=MMETSP0890 /ASSEMBLY_ACC=CAM_ASM_000533 /LENGTH=792 /DNA_ID=CAMNT_0042770785 /DNA_START=108 /DNA_END=2486 /DNA_ORIENTATION=-
MVLEEDMESNAVAKYLIDEIVAQVVESFELLEENIEMNQSGADVRCETSSATETTKREEDIKIDSENEKIGYKFVLEDLALAIVGFHHKRGNVVEAVLPNSLEKSDELAFGALPDGAHHSSELEAWSYLSVSRNEGSWYGATRVWQRVGEGEGYESRGHVQQALCILCTRPLYANTRRLLLSDKWEELVYERSRCKRFDMLGKMRQQLLQTLNQQSKQEEEDNSVGCGAMCRRLGAASVWRLIKTVLLERSVIFAADQVKYSLSAASESALALANFIPGFIDATCKSETSTNTQSIIDTTIPEQLARQNQLGVEYLGAVLGERAVLRPNVSLAHLNGGSLASSQKPGRLVICGCSNPHLALQLASRHARSAAAAFVTVPAREKHFFSMILESKKTFSDDGTTENVATSQTDENNDQNVDDNINNTEKSPKKNSLTQANATATLFSRTLTAGQLLSSSPLYAMPQTTAQIRYHSSDPASSSMKMYTTTPSETLTNEDPMTGDWIPTRSERELLDAIDEAICKEEHLETYTRGAFVHILSQMLADVAATSPENCEALAERWDGKFLYAWLSGTRSGAEWANVFAPQWAEILCRRRDLAELLIPTLSARLARGAAGAAEQLNRTADAIGAAAKPRAAWVANAASKSLQVSLQALDQVEGAATKTWQAVSTKIPQQQTTTNDIVGSAANLVASFSEVVSEAATKAKVNGGGFASRWGAHLKTAFVSATTVSTPATDSSATQNSDSSLPSEPLVDTQPAPAFNDPPPSRPDASASSPQQSQQLDSSSSLPSSSSFSS